LQMAGGEDLDLPSGPPMAAVPGDGLDSSAFEHGGDTAGGAFVPRGGRRGRGVVGSGVGWAQF
jgi:hypothetical protein